MKCLLLALFTFVSFLSYSQTESYYTKASDYYDQKDYKNAISQIVLALQKDSVNAKYLLLKGNALQHLKQFQLAYNTYSEILQLYPDDIVALNQRGLLLASAGEFESSILDFDQGLKIATGDSMLFTLLLNRGVSKLSMRDFTSAYDDFYALYKIDSTDIGTLNNLATVCDEVGKGDQTLKYLFKIIAIDSSFIGTYVNIGFKYQEMGQYKKSISFFDKAISMDPKEALSYNNRGFNNYKLGNLTEALADINQSISLYPSNSYAFRNRALVYLKQKKIEKACPDLDRAIELGFTKMYGDEVEKLRMENCKQLNN